ncbi:hypothetical protein PISMIDRAFT_26388 [Pisolithus microcarpus 441]|uniref:Uncharacterized protein n=1 Tax=Pisolithus microcarpus 441 TaxID=765257 RepID=A0A0C9ZX28_9AGAM|nr:hypothetical protein PISMIDRAFT_26388 [Pisolithus microcarpus 441]
MTDVPSKLGELMVQGWVLTDNPCPAPDCGGVPLLRSPKGQELVVQHCVSYANQIQSQPSSTVSSASHASRPSTPPTEVSSNLSSPTFAPPVETEEMRRRRQQSDNASTEIGKRLLKGWAMLGEECPNSRCYGIPLVRPPTKNGVKDTRKECVACGTVYMTESDDEAWQRLMPTSSIAEPTSTHPTSASRLSVIGPTVAPNIPQKLTVGNPSRLPDTRNSCLIPNRGITTADTAAQALQLALGVLSERLTVSCAAPSLVDPPSIAETSDAINKVAQALGQVNRLRQQDYGRTSSLS